MRQSARLGHVSASIASRYRQNVVDYARTAGLEALELFGIQQIAHHHESVAMKDARGARHFVGSDDLQPVNAVVQTQMLAQRHHVRIVVRASLRRAWICHTETGIRLRRIAVVVNGFVGGRAFVPTDAGVRAHHRGHTSVTRANLRLPT